MKGTSVVPVIDSVGEPRLSQKWNAVAADGRAVLWRVVTAPPGAPDSTGYMDHYRSVRGDKGWQSTYVSPPGATAGTSTVWPAFVSPEADYVLWRTGNATIDPSDHDPVATAGQDVFVDLYRTGPDGIFDRVTRGSLEVPVIGERVTFLGASEDLDKVVFSDSRPLEPDAPPGGGIYERDGQTTRLVSKDETGTPFPSSDAVIAFGTSADGSVVAFTTLQFEDLYVWSQGSGETVKAVGPVLPAAFQGDLAVDSISADGKKIFFTTAGALTANDTDTSRDLYAYDTVTRGVTLLSAPGGGGASGNSDACAAPLPGGGQCDVAPVTAAGDGSEMYFVSSEQIVSGQGASGGVNLYLSTEGDVRFVATLDAADPVFNGGGRARHVRVTPDGAKLMFESRAALTNYDNAGHMEVYLYDPISEAITCVSCRLDGAAATADASLSSGPSGLYSAPPIAPANADEHGDRIFFNSFDAIVPQDTNGRNDVYEYTLATRTPALISSGVGERDSTYAGNGVDGHDVFFFTTDTLVPEDRNGNVYKLYDARMGGGFPTAKVPTVCQGASCRPDETAPQPVPQGTGRIAPRMRRPEPKTAVSRVVVSGSRSVKGTSVRLTAKVSGAGRLSVVGRGLVGSSRMTSRAASYHLTVRLSKASAATVRRGRRLLLSATVRFAPSKGAMRSVRVRLTFTAPSNRNAR